MTLPSGFVPHHHALISQRRLCATAWYLLGA